MVEMEVGKADVQLAVIPLEEPLPELADPGAGVEDQRRAVGELELDARGVAAVADGGGSRRGERSPRAPDADDHGAAGSSQKIDMDSDDLVRAREEREGGDGDLALAAVQAAERERAVSRPPLQERDARLGVCSAVSGCSSNVRGSKSSCQREAGSSPMSRYERPINSAAASLK